MEKVYNQFSEEHNKVFLQNILQFQENLVKDEYSDSYYTNFYPSFGIKPNEKCDFLILGQAAGGWESGFSTGYVINQDLITSSVRCSNKFLSERDHSPLDWVNAIWSKDIYNKYCQDDLSKNFYSDKYNNGY